MVFGRELGQAGERGYRLVAHEKKGAIDLELLHILSEVSGGHSFVKLFVSGEIVEFFDAGFDIMSSDALTGIDRFEINLVFYRLVGFESFVGNIKAEVFLSTGDGEPELTFE